MLSKYRNLHNRLKHNFSMFILKLYLNKTNVEYLLIEALIT